MAGTEFRLLRDIIAVVKQDGRKIGDIQADFRDDELLVPVRNLPVPLESGDTIERQMPFEKIEVYQVVDPGYAPGKHVEPAYRAKLRRESEIGSDRVTMVSHTYQYGPNARVNVHSTDQSINHAYVQEHTVFAELRQAIQAKVDDQAARDALLSRVDALEEGHQSGGYLAAFQTFMQDAANFTTIVGPFLPALSKLLGG